MSLDQLAQAAVLAAIITIIVEVIKRTLAWSDETTARFAPLFAVTLGAILNTLITIVSPVHTGETLLAAVLWGVLIGASSVGLYNLGGKQAIRSVAGAPSA
jgi:hypothetical protein